MFSEGAAMLNSLVIPWPYLWSYLMTLVRLRRMLTRRIDCVTYKYVLLAVMKCNRSIVVERKVKHATSNELPMHSLNEQVDSSLA